MQCTPVNEGPGQQNPSVKRRIGLKTGLRNASNTDNRDEPYPWGPAPRFIGTEILTDLVLNMQIQDMVRRGCGQWEEEASRHRFFTVIGGRTRTQYLAQEISFNV